MPPAAVTIIHSLQPQPEQLAVPLVNSPNRGKGETIVVLAVAVQPEASVIVKVYVPEVRFDAVALVCELLHE